MFNANNKAKSKRMSTLKEPFPSNRKFGLIIGTICIFLFLFGPVVFSKIWCEGLGLLLIFFALFMPNFLSVPNRIWMKFGSILHKLTNPIFMFFLYIIIFCPLGLTLKLFKRFSEEKKLDTKMTSYWIKKETMNSMKNQF